MNVVEQKKLLRREIRAKLAALDAAERAEFSSRIVQNILSSSTWQQAKSVLLFSPLASEPDLGALFSEALTAKKEVYFPRVVEKNLLVCRVENPEELQPGAFGIFEPNLGGCVPVEGWDCDLILVPGLAYDASGGRLGRGRGYFDKLLALTVKAQKVGVFFSCQEVPEIPVESHDVKLDGVFNEQAGR